MSNCRKNCVIRAESVTLTDGSYHVTLPDGSLSNLCACEPVLIGIYTSIPLNTACNLVVVTDGTETMEVYKCEPCCNGSCIADLWRTTLQCRTILCLNYAPTSNSLTINGIKGKRCGVI